MRKLLSPDFRILNHLEKLMLVTAKGKTLRSKNDIVVYQINAQCDLTTIIIYRKQTNINKG